MRAQTAGTALVLVLLMALTPTATAQTAVPISGTIGEVVDPFASNTDALRYVGDPAPQGYAHTYQWGTPNIVSGSPEVAPVVISGTIDVTQRVFDTVALIGLLDRTGLAAGDDARARGAYIYIQSRPNGSVRIQPSDGEGLPGELVQGPALVIAAADLPANGILSVTLRIDGTADPATCDVPDGSAAGADGCLYLTVGTASRLDSYGTIVSPNSSAVEFADGGHPGWEAFPSGSTGIGFSLSVSPASVVPQPDEPTFDCDAPPPPGAIIGTSGKDNLKGTEGPDVIYGLGGDDKIDGRGGDDIICAGDGDDNVKGRDGNDTIIGGPGNDHLDGDDGDDRIYGGSGDDKLHGKKGNDLLAGNDGDDQLKGDDGDDVLYGGLGADRLHGDKGVDLLFGGRGDDDLKGRKDADSADGGPDNDRCKNFLAGMTVNCERA